MPGLFRSGLYQKHFGGDNIITTAAIQMGCTKGRGSTTRMLNYCNKRQPESACILRFVKVRG